MTGIRESAPGRDDRHVVIDPTTQEMPAAVGPWLPTGATGYPAHTIAAHETPRRQRCRRGAVGRRLAEALAGTSIAVGLGLVVVAVVAAAAWLQVAQPVNTLRVVVGL